MALLRYHTKLQGCANIINTNASEIDVPVWFSAVLLMFTSLFDLNVEMMF